MKKNIMYHYEGENAGSTDDIRKDQPADQTTNGEGQTSGENQSGGESETKGEGQSDDSNRS